MQSSVGLAARLSSAFLVCAVQLQLATGCAPQAAPPPDDAGAPATSVPTAQQAPSAEAPFDVVALVSQPGTCTSARFVQSLPATLIRAHGSAGLKTVRDHASACEGIAKMVLIEGRAPALSIELREAVDASMAATFLGVQDPFLVSTTVHQERFQLATTAPSQQPLGFVTDPVRFGAWIVTVSALRPQGPLPTERFGPGPAYDLKAYTSVVTHVTIALARAGEGP